MTAIRQWGPGTCARNDTPEGMGNPNGLHPQRSFSEAILFVFVLIVSKIENGGMANTERSRLHPALYSRAARILRGVYFVDGCLA